ncbi:MAG: hypothetical protein IKT58_04745 [Oscillospiraceae bacterium]|nr:hypothetical protein [Oscillospiraceae bacterium]
MTATRYYVSKKNPLTWLAIALALGSATLQILALCCGQQLSTVDFWFQKVLPIWVGLGFAFIVVFRGKEELYRMTKPVFWACVYFGQVALYWHLRLRAKPELMDNLSGGYNLFKYLRYMILCWIVYAVVYFLVRLILTGKLKSPFILPAISIFPVAVLAFDCFSDTAGLPIYDRYNKLANVCLTGALFCISLAMRKFTDGKYHKTWGDRSDGRLVRSVTGMNLLAGFFMPDRNDACNSIRDTIEISAIERYIHKKRQEGLKSFGITHVLLATYVRCVAKYPGLNRFFSGQRVHQRDDEIIFIMVVKKDMTTDAPDTTIKLHLNVRDTAEDIYHKLNEQVEQAKGGDGDSGFDSLIGVLSCIPRLLLKFLVWLLKLLDYFGKLPRFLLELSPFHGSVIFTSMGSLGIPPVVHHLYNFGNLPVFLAFGRKYRKTELNSDGEAVTRRYVDISMNTDERTTDGFYYATVLKHFQKICRNPSQLDQPPAEVIRDAD